MIRYFKTGNEYIALSGETTMKGTIHVGRGPNGTGQIVEQCWHDNQLARMVEVTDVPDEWVRKLGYEGPRPAPVPEPGVTEWQIEVKLIPDAPHHTYLPGYWRDVALLAFLFILACWWFMKLDERLGRLNQLFVHHVLRNGIKHRPVENCTGRDFCPACEPICEVIELFGKWREAKRYALEGRKREGVTWGMVAARTLSTAKAKYADLAKCFPILRE